ARTPILAQPICCAIWSARLSSPSTRCAGAGGRTAWRSGRTVAPRTCRSWTTRPAIAGWSAPASSATGPSERTHLSRTTQESAMNFLDGSLFPENQQKLVITAAPYGPEWMPADFPEDIPVSMAAQIQKAVDCYNAGATVLHLHVRELDGKGSKRLSKFNELLAGIRARAPELILQVGGSISFAPEAEGEVAKWLSDDTRHMLAELQPRPDQVTIAINTNQMNVVEQMCEADLAGTSMAEPAVYRAYREMK